MPGIVGIISNISPEKNKHDLDRMISSLMHEPTYQKASYVDENAGYYFGSVSHRGAFDDTMPVFSKRRDIILLFSGETFGDELVVPTISDNEHYSKQDSAEYLVHSYEELGDEFFLKLNGWFCGVLIDKRKGQAILFNDRFGMKRVYYSKTNDGLRFSTEAKALLMFDNAARSFDERGLMEYFGCGCPLQHRTLFKGIQLLPGASKWEIESGKNIKKLSYFDYSVWESQEVLPLETFYVRLRDTFRRILPRYLKPRPTIGISLTGGLDTRMIMAHAKLEPHQIPCYTFSGVIRDCYDAKIAQQIANLSGQEHKIIRLTVQFLKDFHKFAEKATLISEGAIDLSATPELYVNSIARESGLVRLTGNYGGEVLRRIRWLKGLSRAPAGINPDLNSGIVQAKSIIDQLYRRHSLSFTLLYDGPWNLYGRYAVESSQVVMRSPYMDNDFLSLAYQAPPEATASKAISFRLIAEGNTALAQIPTDRGLFWDMSSPLKKVNRAFLEALFKSEYLFNYGAPQWLVFLEHYVPFLRWERLFLGRHKFYHFRSWFRDELSGFVKDILLDERALSRSYINRKQVKNMVILHTTGRGNYTNEIHQILALELTSRIILGS